MSRQTAITIHEPNSNFGVYVHFDALLNIIRNGNYQCLYCYCYYRMSINIDSLVHIPIEGYYWFNLTTCTIWYFIYTMTTNNVHTSFYNW